MFQKVYNLTIAPLLQIDSNFGPQGTPCLWWALQLFKTARP